MKISVLLLTTLLVACGLVSPADDSNIFIEQETSLNKIKITKVNSQVKINKKEVLIYYANETQNIDSIRQRHKKLINLIDKAQLSQLKDFQKHLKEDPQLFTDSLAKDLDLKNQTGNLLNLSLIHISEPTRPY